ncbi:MAG TPA: hypothetical protein VKQ31_04680 [Steroidobacteraceae bacterium]|nr:hypothetical protein [Steroidobacteraceae bacterium]
MSRRLPRRSFLSMTALAAAAPLALKRIPDERCAVYFRVAAPSV